MIKFADLMTLLQFSAGANLAFATVLTLYDKVLSQKVKVIGDLSAAADRVSRQVELRDSEAETVRKVRRLQDDFSDFSGSLEKVTYHRFRYIATMMGLVAFALMAYGTYHNADYASDFAIWSSFLTVAPLILFTLYALLWASFRIWSFDRRRDTLDAELAAVVAGH